MTLIDFLLLILIIAASALCIALIFYFWKISMAIKAMQKDINELSVHLQPLLKSTTELSDNLKEITDNAKGHLEDSRSIISSIKDRVDTILKFEENVRSGIEGPVMSFIKEITALNHGFKTFLSYFRKKNS